MPSSEQNPANAENELSVDELFEQIEEGSVKRAARSVKDKPLADYTTDPGQSERTFRLNPVFGS